MMDFKNAKELLHLCEEAGSSISDIMLKREIELGEISEIEALARMEKAFHIMRDSARTPVKTPVKSMGGLLGDELFHGSYCGSTYGRLSRDCAGAYACVSGNIWIF